MSLLRLSRVCLLVTLSFPATVLALDTVEPFGAGVSDVELYLGGERLGRRAEAALFASFQLGRGLSDRVSAYVNGSATHDVLDVPAAGSLHVGVYATLLDSAHLDVDVFLDYGTTEGETAAAAGIEVNLDAGRFGLFATAWEDLGAPGVPEVTLGAVATVAPGHQLLVAYEPSAHVVAAGYNLPILPGVELINEVACDLPRDGTTISVMTGVLLTID
jgi:hypothetical protein